MLNIDILQEKSHEELITLKEIKVPSYVRKKRISGRKPLPKDLPRKDMIHDLSVEDRQCACG